MYGNKRLLPRRKKDGAKNRWTKEELQKRRKKTAFIWYKTADPKKKHRLKARKPKNTLKTRKPKKHGRQKKRRLTDEWTKSSKNGA